MSGFLWLTSEMVMCPQCGGALIIVVDMETGKGSTLPCSTCEEPASDTERRDGLFRWGQLQAVQSEKEE